jgi:hypothetical protein
MSDNIRTKRVVAATKEETHVPASGDTLHVSFSGDSSTDAQSTSRSHISDAVRRHRIEFARFVREDAQKEYRETLDRLYGEWEGWNGPFFDWQLIPPHILLTEPKIPRALGDHSPISGWGSTNQIRLRPSILNGTHPIVRPGDEFAEGRFLLVIDILLHETCHQFQTEVLKRPEESYRGHGPVFRDQCNRIGAMLGLPDVRTAKARGRNQHLASCAGWPICVRPPGYYLGAYRHEREAEPRTVRVEEPGPEMPSALAAWLAANPEWAECYWQFGEGIFLLFDQFFDDHPAPVTVQEEAVFLIASSWRHRRRVKPKQNQALPASIPPQLP